MSSVFLLLDKIKVFFGIRGIWSLLPSHRTKCLLQFEATEDDSAWQLLWACNHLENPEQKAELFSQVLEEAHHAELFRTYIRKFSPMAYHRISLERKPLYLNKQDIWKYFPYCIVGETEASQRFSHICNNLNTATIENKELQQLFKKILADEVGHIHKAEQLASELQLPAQTLAREIATIRRRRFTEHWLRLGKKTVSPISTGLVLLTYFILLGPFALIANFKKQDKACAR